MVQGERYGSDDGHGASFESLGGGVRSSFRVLVLVPVFGFGGFKEFESV